MRREERERSCGEGREQEVEEEEEMEEEGCMGGSLKPWPCCATHCGGASFQTWTHALCVLIPRSMIVLLMPDRSPVRQGR